MAISYEKAVSEDLNLGHGSVSVTNPAGGTLSGTKIGLHTLYNSEAMLAAHDFTTGADLGAKVALAIAALPSTGGVVDARGLAGAQSIASSIAVGTKKVVLLLGAGTITSTANPMFTFGSGGTVKVWGSGRETTIIDYTTSSGIAVDFNNLDSPELHLLTLKSSTASDTATAVRILGTDHATIEEVLIDSFDKCINITGTSDTSWDVRILNVQCKSYTTYGINVDHAADTYITGVLGEAVASNPSTGWGFIMDTGASGIYINGLSLLTAGFKIQNSAPSAASQDKPPEFLFANQMLSDTITGTDAVLLDSTLSTADAAGRKGKSYYFKDCWGAYTQTNGKSGWKIAGGQDISLTSCRARLNRMHGIHLSGGNNIRIINPSVLGNNQENNAAGHGIHVDAGLTDFHIIGGRSGNNIAGETGNQKYGINLAGAANNFTLSFIDCTGNATGGLNDGTTTGYKTVLQVRDNASGIQNTDSFLTDKGRLIYGDANCFWDFLVVDANSIIHQDDSGDYRQYNRSTNTLSWVIGSTARATLTASGFTPSAGIVATGKSQFPTVSIGSVAYGSFGTNTTPVANTLYVADIFLPRNFTATGIVILNGTAVSGNVIVSLYDTSGTRVAVSAATAQAGTDAFQTIAFTATYAAIGPARFWIGVQINNTTGRLRTVAANTFIDVLGNSQAQGSFAAPSTMTPPTALTADTAPIAYLY